MKENLEKELVTAEWDYLGVKSNLTQKKWNQTLIKVVTETVDKIKSDNNLEDVNILLVNPRLTGIFSDLECFQELKSNLGNFELYGRLENRFFIIASEFVNEKDKIFISDSSILKKEIEDYNLLGSIEIKNILKYFQ